MNLIGRKEESKQMKNLLNSSKSELCAIIGRRRVGKSFFITEALNREIVFHFTGIDKLNTKKQIDRYLNHIKDQFNHKVKPEAVDWFEAIDLLKKDIKKSKVKKKKVVVFDEFPWLASRGSYFKEAFEDFWVWAAQRKDLLVIICGSSASWMVKKIFRSKGSLYSRVTSRIHIQPFTLKETALFFKEKKLNLTHDAIIKLYMILGGIPFYLDQLERGESIDQAIERLFFPKEAILRIEFHELFSSLFDFPHLHEEIIRILATKRYGLSRNELLTKSSFTSGGGFTKVIDDLEMSGFISSYIGFGKNVNDKIYKLTDPYALFYIKYVESNRSRAKASWQFLTKSNSWQSWSGYAFENLCFLHINEIKKALKIEGVYTKETSWLAKGDEEMFGAQIDLLLDRDDRIINVCEIKYSDKPYVLSKIVHDEINKKLISFQHFTKTKKSLFPTMITSNGLIANKYSSDLIHNAVDVSAFFE
jgi:uncharacterized protein